jgi:outer membrane lipoprotein-sorting protein
MKPKYLPLIFLFVLLLVVVPSLAQVNENKASATATASSTVTATDKSVDSFFDSIEKKTNTIESVLVNVVLTNKNVTTKASLTIKSPDSFAIEFKDGSIQVFYNGNELWIYIDELKEVFYHKNASKKSFLPKSLDFLSPKTIFVKLTRSTLQSLFDISLKTKKQVEDDVLYDFVFKPRFLGLGKKLLGANSYIITFSEKQGLPIAVVELGENSKVQGELKVLEYKINQEIPDKYFNFKTNSDVVTLPLSTVIAQKLEQYVDRVKEKAHEALNGVKKLLWWE